MGVIRVDQSRLAWLASECEQLGDSVASTPPAVSGGFGATSTAVRALHGDISRAASLISGRLRSTGEKVSQVARSFTESETANEDLLDEV